MIEARKNEAVETSVELRLAVHAREMNKVQAAINAQLEQVIHRQKYLEGVNLKLRQSSDDVKHQLLQLQIDPARFESLRRLNVADMSLSEFTELIIYKHLESLSKQIKSDSSEKARMNEKLSDIREDKVKHEMLISQLKKENENLNKELTNKSDNLTELRQDYQKLDKINSLLQERLNNFETSNVAPGHREDERKQKVPVYQQELPPQIVSQIYDSCQDLKDQSSVGFSRLAAITQEVQQLSLIHI